MVEQVSLTISLCRAVPEKQIAGGMPSIVMSVFLLFLYFNNAAALAPKSKEDFLVRFKSAYKNKRLFINTEGTCAANAYMFLGALLPAQKSKHLGNREAIVGDKVFTQWLIYKYREIPAIAEFAETHHTSSDYDANASTLAMYFVEHLETVLDSVSSEPFFTYMGFSSKQQPMVSHAVIIWYNPQDKHIFLVNPQDFIEEGRIIYGAGERWRNYFGAGIRHYSLHKYVEDNMDFFAGLGKVSLLTEFHTDTDGEVLKGGSPQLTITLPDGQTLAASPLENNNKNVVITLENGSLLSVIEIPTGEQYMLMQLTNGDVYQAAMLDSGAVFPVIEIEKQFVPCIVNADNSITPAILLADNTLYPGTYMGDHYLLPGYQSEYALVYQNINLSVVLPHYLQLAYVSHIMGYDQFSDRTDAYIIYSLVNPNTGVKKYIALNPRTHYIFVKDNANYTYFTWLTPTLFVDNKAAIDVAIKLVSTNTFHPQIETVHFSTGAPTKSLQSAVAHVAQLNQILKVVCDKVRLEIGYLQNMSAKKYYTFNTVDEILDKNDLLLCLNIGNKCVSSITLHMVDNVVNIDAYTQHEHQGKLYNKLLRSVSIMLLPYIYPTATILQSVAVNYISAYQMMKYFGGVVATDDADINFEFSDYLGDKSLFNASKEDVARYFSDNINANVVINVLVNAENLAKANAVFDEVLTDFDRFSCI